MIKKETSSFIHKSFNNIIVLIGAGASVLCVAGTVDKRFGKTVSMLATLINDELKLDSSLFTLQQLADLYKYDIPVEIINTFQKHLFFPHYETLFYMYIFHAHLLNYIYI